MAQPLPGDLVEECVRYLTAVECLPLRAVCTSWQRCVDTALHSEIGWVLRRKEVDADVVPDVVPLHLFVDPRQAQCAQLTVQTDDAHIGVRGAHPFAPIHQDAYWWSVAGRLLFQITLHPCHPPALLVTRLPTTPHNTATATPATPPPCAAAVIPDLDQLFPSVVDKLIDFNMMLPFVCWHRFQCAILVKIGDVVARIDGRGVGPDAACVLQGTPGEDGLHSSTQSDDPPPKRQRSHPPQVFQCDEDSLSIWSGLETAYYVCTAHHVIVMSDVKAAKISISNPSSIERLPHLQYGVSPQGDVVLSTKNMAKCSQLCRHSPASLGQHDVVLSWQIEELNERVLGRATRVRLFLMDVAVTGDGTAACLVCPAGHLPPVAVFVVSLRTSSLLACINLCHVAPPRLRRLAADGRNPHSREYKPFNFSVDALAPPVYALKVSKWRGTSRPCITVLLPLEEDLATAVAEGRPPEGKDYLLMHVVAQS